MGLITPWAHQEELAQAGILILREYAICYLAMEERTGKTITAIQMAERSTAFRVLIITKKKALADWVNVLANLPHIKIYQTVNYHQAHKIEGKFDLVILDEAHNYISSFPKVGAIWKAVARLTKGLPIIYVSATPHAQGRAMMYHQFALSSWSPWRRYKNFYQWHKQYGYIYQVEVNGIMKNKYDRTDEDRIAAEITPMFIVKTRKELGFEHEPEDVLHYVELSEETRGYYYTLVKDELVRLPEVFLVADSQPKMRFSLHQLEGGTMKMDGEYYVLSNTEKVDYIRDRFGDTTDTVIMYNYKAELLKLERHFSNARLLQATSYAEGIDLSGYSTLVIYSQDFSTARHTQRRARQANMGRTDPIDVHYILVKKGISAQVYKTVSVKKKNFVDTVFERLV